MFGRPLLRAFPGSVSGTEVRAANAIPRMIDHGRGQEAAKRLLGTELEMALVSDQYAGYRFINS